MDKYVAFLDILGFKQTLKKMNHIDAQMYISNFSSLIYRFWDGNEKIRNSGIKGYIVSDSVILYSQNTSSKSLEMMAETIIQICQKVFIEKSILIRGAIAKGEFEKMEAKELSNLQKGLLVGKAYIDAYLLESNVKTIGIILSKDVYKDITEISNNTYEISTIVVNENEKYNILKWMSIDTLLDKTNIEKFVKLAKSSNWLPHYYNTLYTVMCNEKSEVKIKQIFNNILNVLSDAGSANSWRDIDEYIQKSFEKDVDNRFKTRFLKYLRDNLLVS